MLCQFVRDFLWQNVQQKILRLFVRNFQFVGALLNFFLQFNLIAAHLVNFSDDQGNHNQGKHTPEPRTLPDVRFFDDDNGCGRLAGNLIAILRHDGKFIRTRF